MDANTCARVILNADPSRVKRACEVIGAVLRPEVRAYEELSCDNPAAAQLYASLFVRTSDTSPCSITVDSVREVLNQMAAQEHARIQQQRQQQRDASSPGTEEQQQAQVQEDNVFTRLLRDDGAAALSEIASSCEHTGEQRALASTLSFVLYGNFVTVNACRRWYSLWWVWTFVALGLLFLILCIVLGVTNGSIRRNQNILRALPGAGI